MNNGRKTKIVAFCGKGGVGKTSLSALAVKKLCDNPESRILAIDADPAVGLATALGFTVRKTVDDVRNLLIDKIENNKAGDKSGIAALLDYEIFNALEERGNCAFLAIGRPESEGCYCKINDLLKDVIASLSSNFDYVVIDGEAGIEQINRRVMETVTHLILVSDISVKGMQVIMTLKEVAERAVNYERIGYLFNRVKKIDEIGRMKAPVDIDCIGYIMEDEAIRELDIAGASFMDIRECPSLHSIGGCLEKAGLIHARLP